MGSMKRRTSCKEKRRKGFRFGGKGKGLGPGGTERNTRKGEGPRKFIRGEKKSRNASEGNSEVRFFNRGACQSRRKRKNSWGKEVKKKNGKRW